MVTLSRTKDPTCPEIVKCGLIQATHACSTAEKLDTIRNTESQAVMRRLGMRMLTNPHPEPAWLQVVGVLDAAPAQQS